MNPRNLNRIAHLAYLSEKLQSELIRLMDVYVQNSRIYFSLAAALVGRYSTYRNMDNRGRRLYAHYLQQGGWLRGRAELVQKILRSHGIKAHGTKLVERRKKR